MVIMYGNLRVSQVTWCYNDGWDYKSEPDTDIVFSNELSDRNLLPHNHSSNCNDKVLNACGVDFPEKAVNRCPYFGLPESL